MKTPCFEDPELWVSDKPTDRAQAMDVCMTVCKVRQREDFNACAVDAMNHRPMGVQAGTDYGTKTSKPIRPGDRRLTTQVEVKVCEHCGAEFQRTYDSLKQWAIRRLCGLSCSAKVANELKQRRRAS